MALRWPVEVNVLHEQKKWLTGRVKIRECMVQKLLLVLGRVSALNAIERMLLAYSLAF